MVDLLPWERNLVEPYLGMTFGEIDEAIGTTMRNAIAHITPGNGHRVADYLQDVEACRSLVPILRRMARVVIRDELEWPGPGDGSE